MKKEGTQVSQPNTDTTDHQDQPQRAILPIPDQVQAGLTTYDAKDPDAEFPPIRELRPPEGAPNVLVILLDDVGFGASSAFGGRARRRWRSGWGAGVCATTAFTPMRCARRPDRRC